MTSSPLKNRHGSSQRVRSTDRSKTRRLRRRIITGEHNPTLCSPVCKPCFARLRQVSTFRPGVGPAWCSLLLNHVAIKAEMPSRASPPEAKTHISFCQVTSLPKATNTHVKVIVKIIVRKL